MLNLLNSDQLIWLNSLAQATRDQDKAEDLDKKWEEITATEAQRLYDNLGNLNMKVLTNFRREEVFVSDLGPYTDFVSLLPKHWWQKWLKSPIKGSIKWLKERTIGSYRGNRRSIEASFQRLKYAGGLPLLKKHPVEGTPGNPYFINKHGYSYNNRWLRHIHFAALFEKHLGEEVRKRDNFVIMDIGCSYSIYASIIKKEFPNTKFVLVDFPEQLLLSAYFLANQFPDAKFSSLPELENLTSIDREHTDKFDFTLVPVNLFHKISGGSVDLVTNFFSFGEMRREWFTQYIESPSFKQAEFLQTCNRFESAPGYEPTYDTDLTILDYPLSDFDKQHFAIYPIYPYITTRKNLVSYEITPHSSQYFDFLGQRSSNSSGE